MRNHLPGFMVSLLVHTGIVVLFFSVFTLQSTIKTENEAIPLKLSMFVPPEPAPVIEPPPVIPPEPEPVVQKIVPPEPKPIKKPKPKPKPKKKPRPEPVVKKEPEPVAEVQPVIEPPPETTAIAEPSPQVVPQQAPQTEKLMNEYKARIRRSIEANKHYPRQARRLRQQGTVIVAFTIRQDGSIENLRVTQSAGKSSLDKAALKAIKKINGKFPIPAEFNRTSWDFDVPMQYSLL